MVNKNKETTIDSNRIETVRSRIRAKSSTGFYRKPSAVAGTGVDAREFLKYYL